MQNLKRFTRRIPLDKKYNENVLEYIKFNRRINKQKGTTRFQRYHRHNLSKQASLKSIDVQHDTLLPSNNSLLYSHYFSDSELNILSKFNSFEIDNIKIGQYNRIMVMDDVLNDFMVNFSYYNVNHSVFKDKSILFNRKQLKLLFRRYLMRIRLCTTKVLSPDINFMGIGILRLNADKLYNHFEKYTYKCIKQEQRGAKNIDYGYLDFIFSKLVWFCK